MGSGKNVQFPFFLSRIAVITWVKLAGSKFSTISPRFGPLAVAMRKVWFKLWPPKNRIMGEKLPEVGK